MNVLWYIIGGLVTAILLESGAFIWYLRAEANDRRKHRKITITIKENGTLGIYRSKWELVGREPLTVVPGEDTPLVNLDVHLGSGTVSVYDIRPMGEGWR